MHFLRRGAAAMALAGAGAWMQAQTGCPAFTADTTIRKIDARDRVLRFQGGFVAIVHDVQLDTDGSPLAYDPDNKGTTDLCDGMDPIVDGKRITSKRTGSPCYSAVQAAIANQWRRAESPSFCIYGFAAKTTYANDGDCAAWGGAYGQGDIPRQGPGDPSPGFFISATSLPNPHVAAETPARYLDADRVPYVVAPGRLVQGKALPRGGVAWGWNPKTGRMAAGVIGDTQSAFGEVSIAFAQMLERGRIDPISKMALTGGDVPWPYRRRSTGVVRVSGAPSVPVVIVYFAEPPSPALPAYEPAAIQKAVDGMMQQFGGANALQSCLKTLAPF